mmetsp:Transcript_29340/g.57575  ORF Transcript_29340/g.57575 Transcript_29340/m.57575 type:complete len:224 (-) Transcript_29340:702-1373(-)
MTNRFFFLLNLAEAELSSTGFGNASSNLYCSALSCRFLLAISQSSEVAFWSKGSSIVNTMPFSTLWRLWLGVVLLDDVDDEVEGADEADEFEGFAALEEEVCGPGSAAMPPALNSFCRPEKKASPLSPPPVAKPELPVGSKPVSDMTCRIGFDSSCTGAGTGTRAGAGGWLPSSSHTSSISGFPPAALFGTSLDNLSSPISSSSSSFAAALPNGMMISGAGDF